jgi:hypothetical protein
MILQYFFYLDINTPGKKVFHVYYYKSSVSYAERAYSAAITAVYCYNAVTVLPRYRNSNSPSRSALPLKR